MVIDINNKELKIIEIEDLKLAPCKTRFKKSRTSRCRILGVVNKSYFNADFDSRYNYIYMGKLCYLKFINSDDELTIKYELREIV